MIGSCVWTAGLAMMGNPLVLLVLAESIEVNEAEGQRGQSQLPGMQGERLMISQGEAWTKGQKSRPIVPVRCGAGRELGVVLTWKSLVGAAELGLALLCPEAVT